MAYVTYQEYETYVGRSLDSTIQQLLTDSYIPEAEELIEHELGYGFEAAADTTEKFTVDKDTSGFKLFFDKWCASVTEVKLNSVVLDTANYFLLGEGPYYGVQIFEQSGDSWYNYGETPNEAIEVKGKWAYSETPPPQVKKLIYKYIQDSLKNRSGGNKDSQSNIINSILKMYPQFAPFSYE